MQFSELHDVPVLQLQSCHA